MSWFDATKNYHGYTKEEFYSVFTDEELNRKYAELVEHYDSIRQADAGILYDILCELSIKIK